MIDVHSHIIYGIDDGSRDITESSEIINKMRMLGFDKIILTPHFIVDSKYSTNNKKKKELMNNLKKLDQDVELYLGNEILINDRINELVGKGEISSMNNTSYLLVELPFDNEPIDLDDILDDLVSEDYRIIIAHPERYHYFRSNRNRVVELSNSGILFQCNYESIMGKYGADAKDMLKYMLKSNLVSFLGSDVHRKNSAFFTNFEIIKRDIVNIIGIDKFNKITITNPNKLLNNIVIEHPIYKQPSKKNFIKEIIRRCTKK